jgi:hypothetical protein
MRIKNNLESDMVMIFQEFGVIFLQYPKTKFNIRCR